MSRCLLAAAVAALTLLGPAAAGAQGPPTPTSAWYELGSSASPVNHDQNFDAAFPVIAADGDRPYVAYVEDPLDDSILFVARLTGSPLAPRPWQNLAGPHLDAGARAEEPDIAVIGGVPYVAWAAPAGDGEIRVARWTGSSWEDLGNAAEPTSGQARHPQQPSLAGVGGVPHVAYSEEDADGHAVIRVRRLAGGAWEPVGGDLRAASDTSAIAPALADVGGQPFVAFEQYLSGTGTSQIHARRLDGATWSAAGATPSPISDPATNADSVSLAGVAGRAVVAWHQDEAIYVKRYDGTTNTWGPVMGAVNIDAETGHGVRRAPAVADVGGVPYVAYLRYEDVSGVSQLVGKLRVRRPTASGTGWVSVGNVALNATTTEEAGNPDIVGIGGSPVVTWEELDGRRDGGEDGPGDPDVNTQVHVKAFGGAPINTGAPQLSGVPQTGRVLTCTNGSWSGATAYTVLWERAPRAAGPSDPAWNTIDDAVGSTYTVQAADEGSRVRCRVVARSPVVAAEAVSASKRTDADVPRAITPPQVSGSPVARQTLTCTPGTWSGSPDFQYQWLRSGVPIAGATRSTYVTTQRRVLREIVNPNGDGDRFVSCRVLGTNDVGTGPASEGGHTHVVDDAPYPVVLPKIEQIGQGTDPLRPLNCSYGSWLDDYAANREGGYAYEFQWRRNGALIAGATRNQYKPTAEDYGRSITCRVYNTNPAGRNQTASDPFTVKLPEGTSDSIVYKAGGTNPADPTNLMALSGEYIDAVRFLVVERLNKGIDAVTTECRKNADKYRKTAPSNRASIKEPVSTEDRCRILLYDRDFVQPYFDGGVRYRTGACTPAPEFATATVKPCVSLGIRVDPIDPLKPPAQDAELLARLAPVTPKTILWDINGDGRTDAACPGSAPVLRTIYDPGKWHPRAVILNQQDVPAHYGDVAFTAPGGSTADGKQRDGQVKVCATSFEPPKNPEYPCVTEGDIGRIHISDANLCPIDARQINNEDFVQLIDGDLQKVLIRASEAKLADEGAITAARGAPNRRAEIYRVPWDPPTARAAQATPAGQARQVSATAANTVASLSTFDPSRAGDGLELRTQRISRFTNQLKVDRLLTDVERGVFVTDQIYVSRGDPLTINGVVNKPAQGSAALLVPSEVKEAVKSLPREMRLLGRDMGTQLGGDAVPNPIPLALGGKVTSTLRDLPDGAAQTPLRESNLDQMKEQAGDELRRRLEAQLNIEPFKLMGQSEVVLNKDGTATLKAHAGLPGLTGIGGKPLGADITITADKKGRISFNGIELNVEYANLGGILLKGLHMVFQPDTGLNISGQMMFPDPIGQGIDIREFRLGPKGQFQALKLDYLPGPGGGIPIGSGLYMTKLGAGIDLQKDEFDANTTIGVGTSVGQGCPAIGVNASLLVRMAHPFRVQGDADVLVTCITLAKIRFALEESGLISLVGSWNFDAGPLYVKGEIGAAFHLPRYQVWLDAEGGIRHLLEGEVHLVLSNLGLAGCGKINIRVPGASEVSEFFGGDEVEVELSGGAAIGFVNGRPPLSPDEILNNLELFFGCDIGRYYSIPEVRGQNFSAFAAQARGSAFAVKDDAGPTLLSIEGAGGAPLVKLRSPSGKVYDFTDATGKAGKPLGKGVWGTVIPEEDRTVAIFARPEAGTWMAETADGSSAVVRIRGAQILPPVGVRGRVTGRGATRTLHYDVLGRKGQSIRFIEEAAGGSKELRTVTRGGKGTVRYTLGETKGSKRRIVAEVTQDGLPRKRVVVARYSAKNVRVGAARRVRVRRQGSRAVITWAPATMGRSYLVEVTYGTGETVLRRPKGRARRVTVSGVRRGEGLRVRIQTTSAAGRKGPLATGKLAGSMRTGAVVKTPRYTKAMDRAARKRARARSRKR